MYKWNEMNFVEDIMGIYLTNSNVRFTLKILPT
jgi:hypothetical protein